MSLSAEINLRPLAYRDLDTVLGMFAQSPTTLPSLNRDRQFLQHWYAPLKLISFIPHHLSQPLRVYVAEKGDQVLGAIQVSPFNKNRTTWQVDQLVTQAGGTEFGNQEIGTQLLRHCFTKVWEARTWLLEVSASDSDGLGLYRHNGFQPLAQLTYWTITPEQLASLAAHEPDLPNLLPATNADAALLCQLDTAAMPALVRQVFDRHICDFKAGVGQFLVSSMQTLWGTTQIQQGYVFEPQRKAAIGYYSVELARHGNQAHQAQITVHPAYTWLYPELLSQISRLTQAWPSSPLHLTSTDYQPEREAFFEQVGASQTGHTLMMSRSVWHKVREVRPRLPEGLALGEVIQGLQQNRQPLPGRMARPEVMPLSPPGNFPHQDE